MEFIFKWMSGTPDFSFTFDDPFIKMIKDNPNTTGLYMAAMAKYSLENREASKDSKLVKTNAIKALLQYCENKDNNLKMTKQLKKLAEARDSGTLEEML
ncbi:MAG: hypothetical protein EOP53_06525 [Sphingobacteriales bacterium]|nr:MAG: hypothetical protein EOP53_06525 [Sphingobacteriales bacterium]